MSDCSDCNTVITKKGEKGDKGDRGIQGTAGTPGGPQGPQGPQGIQGVQGDPGTNGTNGTNGTDGTDAPPLTWIDLTPFITTEWAINTYAEYAIDPLQKILYLKGSIQSTTISAVATTKIPFVITGIPKVAGGSAHAVGRSMVYDYLNLKIQQIDFNATGASGGVAPNSNFWFGLVTSDTSATIALDSIPPIHLDID